MSFFQMNLPKFPKTIGLTELKKGYFPHLFNTDDHQTYVGSLPDQHYYMPDGMSVDDRDAFRRWNDKLTREGYVFDFRRELLEYCKSDVLLLKQGCMTFKREFEAKAGFDPFDQMAIASACNRYLRTHCLQPNTIACEPLLGWGGQRVSQSPAAFEWLAWEAHLVSTPIRHAHNRGEVRPLPDQSYTADGVSGTGSRPVFSNVTNRSPDSSVVPWTTSSPYIKKNTTFFANTAISADRSGNVSGRVDVPPIPPSEPSCNRTRPLARLIRATPSSVDVPAPTNSTSTWKVTNVSSTTISRACTLTSTSTAATLSVIPRSSPNCLSTKASTCVLGSCAVPSYRPPICCIPCCRTDAVSLRSCFVPLASASTSMPRYSTRTSTTVITPTPNALSPVRGAPPNSPWQSEYSMVSPLKIIGSGTGRRLMLMESVIAAAIAAALAGVSSDLGVDSIRRLDGCWYKCF